MNETELQRSVRLATRVRTRLLGLWFETGEHRRARDAEVEAIDDLIARAQRAEVEQLAPEITVAAEEA